MDQETNIQPDPASFRDPAGSVFFRGGHVYRSVQASGLPGLRALTESGLYEELVSRSMLLSHKLLPTPPDGGIQALIKPERIPFISYPYEWCFGQLQDCALLTLDIQNRALNRGMSLKDASSFNVQFLRGKPIFIDTLSFELLEDGAAWIAYHQFCRHFLAPLAIASHVDHRSLRFLGVFLDGLPLDLSCSMLPLRAWLKPGLLLHLVLHSWGSRQLASGKVNPRRVRGTSPERLSSVIHSLKRTVASLSLPTRNSVWVEYYASAMSGERYLGHKRQLVDRWLEHIQPEVVWDLGANTGEFSRLASERGASAVAFDQEAACIQELYRCLKSKPNSNLLPLVMDLMNPSPFCGWASRERSGFFGRRPTPDLVLALALVHHLAIANNVPFGLLARTFCEMAPSLIVEFVPKEDPKTQQLLSARRDIFPDYSVEGFERQFGQYFQILESARIHDSARRLYFMKRR